MEVMRDARVGDGGTVSVPTEVEMARVSADIIVLQLFNPLPKWPFRLRQN